MTSNPLTSPIFLQILLSTFGQQNLKKGVVYYYSRKDQLLGSEPAESAASGEFQNQMERKTLRFPVG